MEVNYAAEAPEMQFYVGDLHLEQAESFYSTPLHQSIPVTKSLGTGGDLITSTDKAVPVQHQGVSASRSEETTGGVTVHPGSTLS